MQVIQITFWCTCCGVVDILFLMFLMEIFMDSERKATMQSSVGLGNDATN